MWHPDVEDVLDAHEQAGKLSEIRTEGFHMSFDRGVEQIESVIAEAKARETVVTAAAVYLKQLIENHPFNDGNHRTAYLVTLEFLRRNDARFVADENLGTEEMVNVLKNKIRNMTVEDVTHWITTGQLP